MPLKSVIFDWGGVLVRTRTWELRAAWEKRLGLLPGQASDIIFGADTEWGVQLGAVSDEEHWENIGRRLHLSAADLLAFQTDFFAQDQLDEDLMAHIARLRERYTIGLLSNAPSSARRLLRERYRILDYFDSVTISAEEGIMKPDARIYQIALARAGVAPGEALYVDDVRENIEAAARLGMQTVHFVDPGAAREQLVALTGVA